MIAQESDILSRQITTLPDAKRVLVLAPHPDDEVFGCGGIVALLRDQGAAITLIVVTDGAAGGENRDGSLAVSRADESRAAATLLGLSEPVFWGYPDRGLVYGEKLIERLSEVMLSVGADLVLLPSPTELHPDHQALALAGAEALRRQGGSRRAAFYEINIPLPNPNLFIDISSVAEQKMAAMACFTSQLQQQPYDKRIEGLNRFRSYFLGAKVASAEAFLLVEATALTPGLITLFEGPLAHRHRLGFAASGEDLPLVSIIVRSMSRPSLARALDSLALQTWPNLEVIVVNAKGGEHGPLPDQCGPFPLRLVNQGGERLSRSSAANAGLAACRGVYLGFLDDDDSMDPDHIFHLVEALQSRSKSCVAYAGVRGISCSGRQESIMEFREPGVDFIRLLLGNILPIHAVLFPSDLLKRGSCFDESLEIYEDWDFWLQLARQAPFVFVDRVSATYYTGGDSAVGLAAGGDTAITRQATERLLAKWLNLLQPAELGAIADRHHYIKQSLLTKQAALQHQVAEREVWIADRDAWIKAQDSRINDLGKTMAAQAADFSHALATQEAHLASLYASRSWRASAPLRWGAQKARRIRQIMRRAPGTQGGIHGLAQRAMGIRPWPVGPPYISQGFAGEPLPLAAPESNYQPLISVIMPVYNACRSDKRYFIRALESIVSQTYSHLELVVVDDGSTDETRQVFEDFLARHPGLQARYYAKENGGQSSARNYGARHCNGKYIGFLDQDDEWFADKLEKVVPWLGNPAVDVVYTDADVIDGDDKVTYHKIHQTHCMGWPHPKSCIEDILFKDIIVMPGLMTIKKELFDQVGGFDERLSGYEDDDLFLRLYQHGRIFYLPETTLRWRIYGENYSFSHRMLASRTLYWKKLMEGHTERGANRFREQMISQRFFWEFINRAVDQYQVGNSLYKQSVAGAREILPYLSSFERFFFSAGFLLPTKQLIATIRLSRKLLRFF